MSTDRAETPRSCPSCGSDKWSICKWIYYAASSDDHIVCADPWHDAAPAAPTPQEHHKPCGSPTCVACSVKHVPPLYEELSGAPTPALAKEPQVKCKCGWDIYLDKETFRLDGVLGAWRHRASNLRECLSAHLFAAPVERIETMPMKPRDEDEQLYADAESFFAQDGWDGEEPHVVAVAFAKHLMSRAAPSEEPTPANKWKQAIDLAWTAGMLAMTHNFGGRSLSAHDFITSLKVAMRQATYDYENAIRSELSAAAPSGAEEATPDIRQDALLAALEWAAKYPLEGTASQADTKAAESVYAKVLTAIKARAALHVPEPPTNAEDVASIAYQIFGSLWEFLPVVPVRIMDYFSAIANGKTAENPLPFSPDECIAAPSGAEEATPPTNAPSKVVCAARHSNTDPPQDCDWPFCGCDTYADGVIEAIHESGFSIVRDEDLLKMTAGAAVRPMNGLSHKFDESHICTACGHSEAWADKWQSFECKPETISCPYCQKLVDVPVERKIIALDWNPKTRKKFVSERKMEFCSEECGLHYQMSTEG